jgi:hypothetical protein
MPHQPMVIGEEICYVCRFYSERQAAMATDEAQSDDSTFSRDNLF